MFQKHLDRNRPLKLLRDGKSKKSHFFVNKVGNVCTNLKKWRNYETWSYFTSINESIFDKEIDLSGPEEKWPKNVQNAMKALPEQ